MCYSFAHHTWPITKSPSGPLSCLQTPRAPTAQTPASPSSCCLDTISSWVPHCSPCCHPSFLWLRPHVAERAATRARQVRSAQNPEVANVLTRPHETLSSEHTPHSAASPEPTGQTLRHPLTEASLTTQGAQCTFPCCAPNSFSCSTPFPVLLVNLLKAFIPFHLLDAFFKKLN